MNIFKKITTGVLALTIGMCAIPSAVSASMNESYRKGDIDGDGDVDNVDSAYLSNFLSGIKGSANNQMSQRLDVDLSGIIDKLDKELLSNMLVNGASPIYYCYEDSNAGVPPQQTLSYRKYDAQTGTKVGDNYTLSPVSNISTTSKVEPEIERGTDYTNPGIVKINATEPGVTGWTGTGFVVGSNKILTAAHCVYNTHTNTPFCNISIDVYDGPGYSANNYSANYYHIPENYHLAPDYVSYCDYAIITVDHTFSSDYIMNLGVARDKLKNNTSSSVYYNYNDNGVNRLGIFYTYYNHWAEMGCLKRNDPNQSLGVLMTDNVFYCSTLCAGGYSGCPAYAETEDDFKSVIGICSGRFDTPTYYYSVCKRIDTNILQFALNNPNLT
ncbi:trypsin-like serine protease [Ruminococcus sp. HUN007]|uniref:trypsin-like serine peptidase n=1 Tax=Ruminococcus sp. HUN007 TaxID=1514668 RepID=UPI0005D20261|nr:trypsin-like serine protease [Ruminococcus sp. HUN007]